MKLRQDETAPFMDQIRNRRFSMRLSETPPIENRDWPVLLCFQRYTGCPLCNSFLSRLSRQIPEQQHHRIFALFHSPKKAVRQWVQSQKGCGFNFLADPEREIYRTYGVESSLPAFLFGAGPWNPNLLQAFFKGHMPGRFHKTPLTLPAHFIVSSSDKILECRYSRTIGGHMKLGNIRKYMAFA